MNIFPPSSTWRANQVGRPNNAAAHSLRNYPVARQVASLGTIAANCSAAAFNPILNTLMMSDNGVPVLHEFYLDGTYRRQITLSGYVDVEAVEWIEGTRYALGEETNTGVTNTITEVDIPATGAVTITKGGGNWIRTLLLSSITSAANQGIECICYDRKRNRFMCATEFGNAGVWNVWYTTSRTSGTGTQLFPLTTVLTGVATDLSDMHHDPIEDVIYLCSHQSAKVMKFSMDGRLLGQVAVPSVHTQVEGMTFSLDMRQMWLTGEAKTFTRHVATY